MLFGLIGKKLSHSYSAQLFQERFANLHSYLLFEISTVQEVISLIEKYHELKGLNVTIPYKTEVIGLLDWIDETAIEIGSVNTILIEKGYLKGYNTDYIGFEKAYLSVLKNQHALALVLGTGGSARAVQFVLEKYNIDYVCVSRQKKGIKVIDYSELQNFQKEVSLVINTTPLGMFPDIDQMPPIPTSILNSKPDVIDLIYNPSETKLLKLASQKGCICYNGLEMLKQQAIESWKIWGLV